MYVHEEKKVAFIAHPRTASSATGHTLLQMGFTIVGNHHSLESGREDWTVGCTVRNPFDVMVSWYHNKPREEKSFALWLPRFIDECHYFDDNHLMFYGQPYATHVLRFENLQKEFDKFCFDAKLCPRQILPRNVSTRKEVYYMSYYNENAKLVVERFRDDFVNNGYDIPEGLLT